MPAFAHESEAELARLFDAYGVAWQYEPRLFVLERDGQGRPVRALAPDFYLPDSGVYVEVTTLQQRLVTRKNRKVREVMERYPGVHITLLYRRDYHQLLAKYGIASAA